MKLFNTALSLLLLAGSISAADFAVDTTYGGTLVQFESDGKLEFIAGKTRNLIGSFVFAPEQPQNGASGVMQVDLRTLKTGINLRDEHMRENHLETDKYPFAWFELTEIAELPATLENGQDYQVKGQGFFYLHGVKRPIQADLSFTPDSNPEGSILKVSAKFSLHLNDFNIKRPKALFLKLAKRIDLEVDFLASTNNSLPDIVLPDWPEKQ